MTTRTSSVLFEDVAPRSLDITPIRSSRWRPGFTTPRAPRSSILTPPLRASENRFIPNRSAGDIEFSRFQLSTPLCKHSTENSPSGNMNPKTPSGCGSRSSSMREQLLALKGQSSENRMLHFKQTPSTVRQIRSTTPGKYEYWSSYSGTSPSLSSGKKIRKTPRSADKVLDAPNLINDFYLNVLDWSKQNMIAIALGAIVYVFDASKGDVHQLCDLTLDVTSLQWSKSGKYLTVGTSDAEIQLWDVNSGKCVRRMRSHQSRVSSLSWNPKSSLLSSGSQSGQVHNYDPRMAQFHVGTLKAHKLDVCGLKWSTNGRFLASGGNDNVINIWDTYDRDPWTTPSHSFDLHTAAVKALSWCPWQPSILASGGGSADKTIRLWNACSGESQGKSVTDSQVSGLVWSAGHRELLSCHGNPSNSLRLWKWQPNDPDTSLHQLAELQGHEGRILHAATNPDGQTVVTAGADETLRFWKCFEKKKKSQTQFGGSPTSDFSISRYIR